jgi:hypothetical protein
VLRQHPGIFKIKNLMHLNTQYLALSACHSTLANHPSCQNRAAAPLSLYYSSNCRDDDSSNQHHRRKVVELPPCIVLAELLQIFAPQLPKDLCAGGTVTRASAARLELTPSATGGVQTMVQHMSTGHAMTGPRVPRSVDAVP